jgi:flagellum-specific ATP synthase
MEVQQKVPEKKYSEEYTLDQRRYSDMLTRIRLYRETGKLLRNVGIVFEGYLPGAAVGSTVRIEASHHNSGGSAPEKDDGVVDQHAPRVVHGVDAEVIGFKDKRVVLMPMDDTRGMSNTSQITLMESEATIPVGSFLLGRVVDGKCEPIDNKGPLLSKAGKLQIKDLQHSSIYASSINPMERAVISTPLDLGVRALNGLLTCGKGQRLGIMAGSGNDEEHHLWPFLPSFCEPNRPRLR